MKSLAFVLFTYLFIQFQLSAQICRDASVELKAVVQVSPAQITLSWTPNAGATQHTVFKKLKSEASWGNSLINLPGTVNQFSDINVLTGLSYEYKIVRNASNYTGYGYINSGIQIPAVENRGKVILLTDSMFISSCGNEINQLVGDLEGDAWVVLRHNISRTAMVSSVKSIIVADYNADPVNTKALFLLGHIPVPYSGNINPDGHPDHQGAWPADVYYADVNGIWTDYSVNNTVASDSRNDNIPGDGKFDQSLLPSDVELQCGRVDFANMPAFSATEHVLMKNYLDKDHDYRHKNFSPVHRALIDDNFGYFNGEAFAASAWKNFGPLVDPATVTSSDYFTTMSSNSYLWSYGCGGGWYQGSSGIGSTTDFAASSLQGVFTVLFGSYFGDWDSQNNFLRAPLAQGTMLTDAWSGRPHWQFHHMALGENMGYSARLTQNNNSLYYSGYGARYIHIALMGDPTLRNDVVAPPANVTAVVTGNHCQISWAPSVDAVLGYYVYMKNINNSNYIRLTQNPVTSTAYTQYCLQDTGIYTYMVKALVLQTSPSGTYYNLSQGITTAVWHGDTYNVTASATYNEDNGWIIFIDSSVNATSWFWDFGDGYSSLEENPQHQFLPGDYIITLIAANDCDTDTLNFNVTIISQFNTLHGMFIYDNALQLGMPYSMIILKDAAGEIIDMTLTDQEGYYTFTELTDGIYSLHPATTIIPGGFNSTDALFAMKHFVHISTLTGLRFQAGDVDNNNFINSLDALMISKRFVNEISGFPAGDWYFEEPSVSLSGAASHTRNLKCICIGDCNGSFLPF
ncbi:MAG: PKD domain-containing protein [Bacteroidales bacterium]